MISDSLRAKHCPPGGEYQLGGHDIEIGEDGLARLKEQRPLREHPQHEQGTEDSGGAGSGAL